MAMCGRTELHFISLSENRCVAGRGFVNRAAGCCPSKPGGATVPAGVGERDRPGRSWRRPASSRARGKPPRSDRFKLTTDDTDEHGLIPTRMTRIIVMEIRDSNALST